MHGNSSKSRRVNLWLSNEAYAEYERLVKGPANPHESATKMMKAILEWYPFRHTTRKYRKRYY